MRNGRTIALDCINNTCDYVQGKALILAGAQIAPADLANTDVPLKELVGEVPRLNEG